jgi:hypothetical protein
VRVCPRCALERALLTPTNTARLRTTTPLRLIAKRDKRIFTPFIGS